MISDVGRLKSCVCLSLAIAMGGCVKYEAQPLSSAAVQERLATPDDSTLRVAASELKHPILKPVTLDPSRGLTPDEAAVMAVLINPDLRAERDQRAIAACQLMQAGLLPNPTLTGSLDFPHGAARADSHTAYGLGIDWDVTSLITLDAKKLAASATSASVELDLAWKEWQIAEAAKLAAYDVLSLEGQLAAAREIDEQLAKNLAVVRRAVDRNDKTLLDLSAAEASAQDSHAAVVGQEKDLRHQRMVLNRALGLAPGTVVKLHAEPLPTALEPPANDQLLTNLESRRLDLLALRKGYDSQEATLRVAVLEQFPKINIGPNIASDTSAVKTVGLGASIDLPIFDQNHATIATEKATRQKLFDEYTGRVFAARADIAESADNIRVSSEEIAVASAAIPALERLAKTYGDALRNGSVDVLSAYAAQNALAQKRINILKLQQQLIENWIALEIASGQILPRGASATQPATQEAP